MGNILRYFTVFFLFFALSASLWGEEDGSWPSFTGPLFLQSQRPLCRVQPESSFIGRIGDDQSGMLPTSAFWKTFRQGIFPEGSLSGRAHPLFVEELKKNLDKGPEITDYYEGVFESKGRRGRVPFVLFSAEGAIKGVLYLIKEDANTGENAKVEGEDVSGEKPKQGQGAWKVEDGDIPFRQWPGKPVIKTEESPDTASEAQFF